MPRLSDRRRALWRSLRSAVGFRASAAFLALLLPGVAWRGGRGGRGSQAWSTFPAERWDTVPLSDATHASLDAPGDKQAPWGLERTSLPLSGSGAGAPMAEVAARHEGAGAHAMRQHPGGSGGRLPSLGGPPDLWPWRRPCCSRPWA